MTPTLDEVRALAAGYRVVPIAKEIFSDRATSVEVLRRARAKSSDCFLFESVSSQESWGRYSFLGLAPKLRITGVAGSVTISSAEQTTTSHDDPFRVLQSVLDRYRSPQLAELPPFTGGLVGYFAYEFARYCVAGLEQASTCSEPDFELMLIDKVIAFDHFKQKIYLIVNIDTGDLENSYAAGLVALDELAELVTSAHTPPVVPLRLGDFDSQFTAAEYEARVRAIQRHIRAGDVYQTVLSNRFSAPVSGDLMQTYRVLRTTEPSPYMVYLRTAATELVAASPESLVRLRGRAVESYPLAGSRPRGAIAARSGEDSTSRPGVDATSRSDVDEDAQVAAELLADPKELAEHDMLVDLARNDLGKVAEFGSVQVDELHRIKRFTHVMHIGSRVSATLRPECSALDVLAAAFPAGTLTGAPKRRACELIEELEAQPRGVYGGAIGYLDFAGNLDLCIAIRAIVRRGDRLSVQAGTGIVADSAVNSEFLELQAKARGVLSALEHTEELAC